MITLGKRQNYYLCIVHTLFMYFSWGPQSFYSEKNIKNKTYSTIHIFKNYFITVFSVLRDFMNVNKMSGCNLLLQQVKRV